MGCHTWCYKRIYPSKEEIISGIEETFLENISFFSDMMNGELEEDLIAAYPDWTPAMGWHLWLNETSRYKKWYNKRQPWNLYMDRFVASQKNLTLFYKGHFYEEADYHDLFRVAGYDLYDLFLTSHIKTLGFMYSRIKEKGKDSVLLYDNTWERLERFWDEHPDGLIKFG